MSQRFGVGAACAPTLVAVAHGSRDPRSAATIARIVDRVRAARPDIPVRTAFLDLTAPSVDQVLDSLAQQGDTEAIVVPLLLGSAFHARVDLPALLAEATARFPRTHVTQADVLGPDPRLIRALRDRVLLAHSSFPSPGPEWAQDRTTGGHRTESAESGPLGVAVAAVGASSSAANLRTAEVSRKLAELTGWQTEICFATTDPDTGQAVARLRERGADRIVVAPWFLAPGRLTDRLRTQAPDIVHAEVLGDHPVLAATVWDRYDTAHALQLPLSA